MPDIIETKHESLQALVAQVSCHLPEADLVVLDWWDGDPYAMALSLRSSTIRRAYVSSARDEPGLYMLSCEITPRLDSDRYHNLESDPFRDLDALAATIAEHLAAT